MTQAAFPPAIASALDHFAVPALPHGFADRLIERAQLRAGIAALPATRQTDGRPWRRTSRVIASIAAISLCTAAAAAGGMFGTPLYVPGITEVMQQANIIKRETPVAAPHAIKPKAVATQAPAFVPVEGKERAKAAMATLRQDPQFQQLRPKQKIRAMVRETRALVKSGKITPQEGRAALRENAKENFDKLTPQQQQMVRQRMQNVRERREFRRALRQERMQDAPENITP